ncbi:MAG TPA: hypothetical protein VIX87_05920 [Steroidobacteraceae bacterium]
MTVFLLAALLLSLLAAAFLAVPLLRAPVGAPRAPWVAALAALLLIGAGAALYARFGDPHWDHGAAAAGSSRIIPTLARHLERQPRDLEGWISLGQAYEAIGRYSLALRCYERANRLGQGNNAAALAGMGEALLLDGDETQEPRAQEFFERALQLDPGSPKALFYSAVIAYHQGHLEVARARFTAMLKLSLPENIRAALQHQIDDIDAHASGQGAASEHAVVKVDAATAIHLHVTLAPALAGKVPSTASLFVFVRAPGGGPPLAVKRSEVRLPQDVDLSAADAMVAGRGVQPGQSVSVVARISASGSPLPQRGDLYGEVRCVAGKGGAQALQIDRLSP